VSRPARLTVVLALASLVAALAVGSAAGIAPVPPGPRLAVIVSPYRAGSRLLTMGPTGEERAQLLEGPLPSQPEWSPDGGTIAYRAEAGENPAAFLIEADGAHNRVLRYSKTPGGPRTFAQEMPIFDPSGENMVVSTYKLLRGHIERPLGRYDPEGRPVVVLALWAIPTDGTKAHPLEAFQRKREIVPGSYAADGTLVADLFDKDGIRIVTIGPGGGPVHTLVAKASGIDEPVFSPDGTQIAYLQDKFRYDKKREERRILSSALMVVSSAGGAPRKVIDVAGGAIGPAWDPSGSRLSYVELDEGEPFGPLRPRAGNALMEVNADGTCPTQVYASRHGTIQGASWQPGEGRGAGPIAC
jgi:Tol biopolymer transport system component